MDARESIAQTVLLAAVAWPSGVVLAGCAPSIKAPRIITAPRPEYADSTRKFQGIPGIERAANGRLWAVWYAGGACESPENYVPFINERDKLNLSAEQVTALRQAGGGAIWSKGLLLDERANISSPAGVGAAGGKIYIYDRERFTKRQILWPCLETRTSRAALPAPGHVSGSG